MSLINNILFFKKLHEKFTKNTVKGTLITFYAVWLSISQENRIEKRILVEYETKIIIKYLFKNYVIGKLLL